MERPVKLSPLAPFGEQAAQAAALLRMLSNESRLLVLCHLAERGELPVGALVERIGLRQSALSQHIAKLREAGLRSAASRVGKECGSKCSSWGSRYHSNKT